MMRDRNFVIKTYGGCAVTWANFKHVTQTSGRCFESCDTRKLWAICAGNNSAWCVGSFGPPREFIPYGRITTSSHFYDVIWMPAVILYTVFSLGWTLFLLIYRGFGGPRAPRPPALGQHAFSVLGWVSLIVRRMYKTVISTNVLRSS